MTANAVIVGKGLICDSKFFKSQFFLVYFIAFYCGHDDSSTACC